VHVLANLVPVSVEIDDNVLDGENAHPLFHIDQPERGRVIRLGRSGVGGVRQSENVRVVVAEAGGTDEPVPAIFFTFFNAARGGEDLEMRLGVGDETGGVVEFKGAFDFEKLALIIIGNPLVNETAVWLDDSFEGGVARIIGNAVDVESGNITMRPGKIEMIGNPVTHFLLQRG